MQRLVTLLVAIALIAISPSARARAQLEDAEDVAAELSGRGRSWLDVRGIVKTGAEAALPTELGVVAELGFAWDPPPKRLPEPVVHAGAPASLPPAALVPPVTPRVARAAVHAAYRTARLLSEDTLEGLSTRARVSGLVPEVRLRAARLWDESAKLEVLPSDALRTSDAARANLWLEARATFRLDRLVFAGEELAVVRHRLEQSHAAQKLALRVVAALAAWQRAWVEDKTAPPGSISALEAALKLSELEGTLEVMTGGWFSSWRAREVR